MESETKTPKEWIAKDILCHNCDLPLSMLEWGDWGYCGGCGMTWNMFLKDNDYCLVGDQYV